MNEVENLIKDEMIRGWRKEQILENIKYIWKNTYCIIENKIANFGNNK